MGVIVRFFTILLCSAVAPSFASSQDECERALSELDRLETLVEEHSDDPALGELLSRNLDEIRSQAFLRGVAFSPTHGIRQAPRSVPVQDLELVGTENSEQSLQTAEIFNLAQDLLTFLKSTGTPFREALKHTGNAQFTALTYIERVRFISENILHESVDPNVPLSQEARTPLELLVHVRADSARVLEATQWLLNQGAEVKIGRWKRNSVFDSALMNGYDKLLPVLIKALRKQGGRFNARNSMFVTSITKLTTVPMLEMLAAAGADMHAVDEQEANALFHVETVEQARFFLQQGLNINSLDGNGVTPLTRALHNWNWDIAQTFLNAGAIPTNQHNFAGSIGEKVSAAEMAQSNGAPPSLVEHLNRIGSVESIPGARRPSIFKKLKIHFNIFFSGFPDT